VNVLRRRIADADALKSGESHSFKELMSDFAVTPDTWYWNGFEELEALGHLNMQVSRKLNGGDANARLSANGRYYVRHENDDNADDEDESNDADDADSPSDDDDE
jgi:hypothetical protein